jgi:hypothetical protein
VLPMKPAAPVTRIFTVALFRGAVVPLPNPPSRDPKQKR